MFIPLVRLKRLVGTVTTTRLEEVVHFRKSRRRFRILRRLHNRGDIAVFSSLVAEGWVAPVAEVGP